MSVVRWGVIGAGDVVRRKSGPSILAERRSDLAAITRRDPLDCGARVHRTAEGLIADPEIDAIYIAVPPDAHEPSVMAALAARKPIVVEKPIAVEVASARRMVRAATEAGVTLSVAYYRRLDPRLIRIAALITAGAIGEVQAVELRQIRVDGDSNPVQGWRADRTISPGGRFSDSHVHALDWLCHMFGPPRLVTGAPSRSGQVAYALQLRDAPVAGVFDPAGNRADDRIIVTGDAGILSAPFFDNGPIHVERTGDAPGHIEIEMDAPAQPHRPFFKAMAAHILDGAPPPAPAASAVHATEIIRKLFAV